jgi:hypothetical protein
MIKSVVRSFYRNIFSIYVLPEDKMQNSVQPPIIFSVISHIARVIAFFSSTAL